MDDLKDLNPPSPEIKMSEEIPAKKMYVYKKVLNYEHIPTFKESMQKLRSPRVDLNARYKSVQSKVSTKRSAHELGKFGIEDPLWLKNQKQKYMPNKEFRNIVSIYDIQTKDEIAFKNLDF